MNHKHADIGEASDSEQYQYWLERVRSTNSRARRLGVEGRITIRGWLEALGRHGGHCALCASSRYLTIDHIQPLGAGGTNTDDNIQPLCQDCNAGKMPKKTYDGVSLHQPSHPGTIYIRSDLQHAALKLADENSISLKLQINKLVEEALLARGISLREDDQPVIPKKINLTDLLYGPAGPQR